MPRTGRSTGERYADPFAPCHSSANPQICRQDSAFPNALQVSPVHTGNSVLPLYWTLSAADLLTREEHFAGEGATRRGARRRPVRWRVPKTGQGWGELARPCHGPVPRP